MRRIVYSLKYREKVLELRMYLDESFGESVCKNTLKHITDTINNLIAFPNSGQKVEDVFGIQSDYWYIYVSKNYIFYRVSETTIEIVNIYNEKEDFIRKIIE